MIPSVCDLILPHFITVITRDIRLRRVLHCPQLQYRPHVYMDRLYIRVRRQPALT